MWTHPSSPPPPPLPISHYHMLLKEESLVLPCLSFLNLLLDSILSSFIPPFEKKEVHLSSLFKSYNHFFCFYPRVFVEYKFLSDMVLNNLILNNNNGAAWY
jgi:hypothetical protein